MPETGSIKAMCSIAISGNSAELLCAILLALCLFINDYLVSLREKYKKMFFMFYKIQIEEF